MNDELLNKIDWLITHLRYTQALCEIILENLPDTERDKLIKLVHDRVNQI